MIDNPGGSTDAYQWARTASSQNFPAVAPAKSPDRGGLNGTVDEAVKWALEKTGAMKWLEQVTGAPEELTQAAETWRTQAIAMQHVADNLRSGALTMSQSWEGAASDAFGGHMGEVVQAIDATAGDMSQTAQILASAAKECAFAEQTVIELISELIEMLVAEAATSAVLDLVTFGLASVADALASAAEVAVYIEKIAKVSEELAEALRKLHEAIKELREALKAGKSIKEIASKAKEVNSAMKALRDVKLFKGAELAEKGLGGKVLNVGARAAAQFGLDAGAGQLVSAAGIDGDTTNAPLNYIMSSTGQQSLLADGKPVPAPYHVNEERFREAFG